MKKYIVISAIGADRPGIIRDLAKAVAEIGCNITDSRMTLMGSDFTLMLLACGSWNAVAKLESQASTLGKKFDLTITAHRTEERPVRDSVLSYVVDVAALDRSGIISDVAEFFAGRAINIDEMSTWSYSAMHTGAAMISINMTIGVPASLHIGRLRDEFTEFCDGLNLDATLEPARR